MWQEPSEQGEQWSEIRSERWLGVDSPQGGDQLFLVAKVGRDGPGSSELLCVYSLPAHALPSKQL